MKYVILPLLLVPVILISGCAGLPADVFGSDVLKIQTTVSEDRTRDVITMKESALIPSPPLLPDQPALLSFVLENQDDMRTAKSVSVDLFNAPLFRNYETGAQCNGAGRQNCIPKDCPSNECCSVDNSCPILPGEQRQINFALQSPAENEIAGIRTDTTLDYKTSYDFVSSFLYTVPVVSKSEIEKMQRAKTSLSIGVQKSYGSGPIKIDADIQGAPYILASSSTTSSQPISSYIMFKLQNKGSGTVKNSKIEINDDAVTGTGGDTTVGRWLDAVSNMFGRSSNQLPDQRIKGIVIQFPDAFDIAPPEGFRCTQNICYNTKDIDIYRDESRVSMRFSIKLRDPESFGDTPYRTYQIVAMVGYTYELRNSISVTINPFQNVK